MSFDKNRACVQAVLYDCDGEPLCWIDDDGIKHIPILGKVSLSVAPPPSGGTAQTIAADDPLLIDQQSSPHLTEWTIPSGKTLYVQQIIAGCQGDPAADGSKVEVVYYNGSTEHAVDRIYVAGQTQFCYPNTDEARDGTPMAGDGSTKKLRIYRSRLSNSSQEIDAVVRGYTI
jgi:hypothetical protein